MQLVLLGAGLILMLLASNLYAASPLVFGALVPILLYLDGGRRLQRLSRRRVVLGSWLVGLLFFLVTNSWLIQNDPSQWAQLGGWPVVTGQLLVWLAASAAFSAQFMLIGLALLAVRRYGLRSWQAVVVLPSVWAIAEFLRSILTSVVLWGEGGTIGPTFNFGSLGLAASGTVAAYPARWLGLYGLSAMVVIVNIWIFRLLKGDRAALAGLLGVVAMVLVTRSMYAPPTEKIEAAVAQSQTDTDFGNNENLKKLADAASAVSRPVDVLVFGEYARFFAPGNEASKQRLLEAVNPEGVAVSTGSETGSSERGQIAYRNTEGNILDLQRKRFLIPAGEYLPAFLDVGLTVTGNDDLASGFRVNRGVIGSKKPERPFRRGEVVYGTLECSGILQSGPYRELANQGANVLVNSGAAVILLNAPTFREQTKHMIRFQAVANARPFIHAAQGGNSAILDAQGRFLYISPDEQVRLGVAEIAPSSVRPPYVRFGEWTLGLWAILLAVLGVIRFKQNNAGRSRRGAAVR